MQANPEDSKSTEDDRQAILSRLRKVLERELALLSCSDLAYLSKVDDTTALAKIAARKLSTIPLNSDRKIRMELEGIQRFNAMLNAAGGYYTTSQVCKLLGKSPNALRKAVGRKKLVQLKRRGESIFPAFQFFDGNILPGISRVLKVLPAHLSTVGAIRFFLAPLDWENDIFHSPLELLRNGQEEKVVSIASMHQEHVCD